MTNSLSQSVRLLTALWRLAQRGGVIDDDALVRESQLSRARVQRHLRVLDAAGLVDARRRRLTLQGLAVAVSHAGRRSALPAPRRLGAGAGALAPVMLPIVSFGARCPENTAVTADEAGV